MPVLWTAADVATATGGDVIGAFGTDWAATGISIDTRSLAPGDLFIALTDQRDGHDFVAQALSKGAAGAMVSRIPDGVGPDAPLIVVPDVLAGLTALGAAGRARAQAKIIAVTGSVGKTSTKEMLRDMLSGQGRAHVAEGSFNNHWGVPITLARMPADCDFAVVEIGMNHPGEIAPLARLARPHVALITTIAAAHLEAFADLDGIAVEKASVFDGLTPDGVAIYPLGLETTPVLARAAAAHSPLAFGREGAQGDTQIAQLIALHQSEAGAVLEASVGGLALNVRLPGAGAHFALNALGCLAVAQALSLDLAICAQDLGHWTPPAGRGKRERILIDPVERYSFTLIDDAYNANPTSTGAALDLLAQLKPGTDPSGRTGRRIAVLGDMLELGDTATALHAGLADHTAMAALHTVHCIGPMMRHLYDRLPEDRRGHHVTAADELGEIAHKLVRPGDIVLVKGSKGTRAARVVDALRNLGQADVSE
ncbi:UDP-N-acetylmuramoyl-tripeptide--D-alanyl-D-alanine ligase [Roseicitreum antarcticum]|uniref:UDP-N-acetylmuramoyl-tripeptide--D-alanyl-D- alanine ligase n=1 Tax=Roseicitreum antarcticum TaxID=564137 RepID=UPI0015A051CB|nr:UDP-N-acetylmuramoyl-tripeptide--D-alanyl-D-alanine ligase [Roseicitreum antarcticum]